MVLTLALYTAAALVVAGVGLYVAGAYNQVVSSNQEADRAFRNVDVSLKQRHDEIPALVETCRGYMGHERNVLEAVTSLRLQIQGAGDVDTKVVAENALTGLLSRVFALAESYPDLKANELFLSLHISPTAIHAPRSLTISSSPARSLTWNWSGKASPMSLKRLRSGRGF